VRIGHCHRHSATWRTGTTVVVAESGAVAGVDVRGGGPGTRETDLLRPENLVSQVHAICLTGGSAFGLAAADGVMLELERRGRGFPVGEQGALVVPIVPTAVIFDLGRAGPADHRPDRDFGARATRAAFGRLGTTSLQGAIGAGIGARAGGLQGGVGTASTSIDLLGSIPGSAAAGPQPSAPMSIPKTVSVSAVAVVNAVGSIIDPRTALPWERLPPEFSPRLRTPNAADRRRLLDHLSSLAARRSPPLNTTIGIVATDLPLTKAECTKVAAVAHDGLARAIRPAHSMHDGDTIFALSTGEQLLVGRPPWWPTAMNLVLRAAADMFAAACTRAVVEAVHVGGPPSFRDLCPSAFRE
ncbi:MAG: P1 family peptidase, partial [Actinomycetota bacterium]